MSNDAQPITATTAPEPVALAPRRHRRWLPAFLLCLGALFLVLAAALLATPWPAAILAAALAGTACLILATHLHHRQRSSALRLALETERQRRHDHARISGDIYWETDTEHRLTWITGRAIGMTEGEAYPHLGRKPWEVAQDGEDEAKWGPVKAAIAAREPIRDLYYTLVTPQGPVIRRVKGEPFHDAAGHFTGYRGVSYEISLQERDKEGLRLVRQVLEASADGVAVTGLPEEDFPILYVNPAFERMTGYTAAEVMGRNPRFLLGPHQNQPGLHKIRGRLRNGESVRHNVTNMRRDGTTIRVELSISPIRDQDDTVRWYVGIHRDVTEETEARRALAEVSERLSLATQATGIGIYDIDLRSGQVKWDPTMEHLYGIPTGSFDGQMATWQSFLHPDDLVSHAETMRAAMSERRGLVTRTRILRADGSVRVLQFRTGVMRDERGKAVRLVGVNRDVTEEHEAQESLRALSRRLTLATEAAAIGIFDLDLKSRRVDFDRIMMSLYGFDAETFDGALETWRSFIHPDDIARIDADFMAHRYSTEPHSTTLRIKRTDGSRRILQEHAVILHDDAGKPARIIGVNWDVTEQQESRATLERLTQRLTLTTRTAGIGFFEWHEKDEASGWDETLKMLHGVAPDFEGTLETWLSLMDPGQRPRARQFVADRFRSRRPGQLEYRIRCPDGALRDLQLHIAPDVDATGRVVRLLGAAWDVTEERETERQLRAARDAARAANEAKDRFLATMSHELRTPLNAILGFAEVISEQAVGPINNPAYREYAQDIHSSGEHLLSLVNDLIDVARIQSAKIRLAEDRIPVGDLLQRLPPLLGDHRYTEDCPDNLDRAVICGDPRLLSQVLVNLVSNARKHGGNTPIHIGAGRLPSGALTLWVTDQGPGIDAANQQLVLEPFGRMIETEAAAIPGVGLGLPIARSYVQAHDGQLYLHSAPELGTTVGMILPAARMVWPDAARRVEPLSRIMADWPDGPCFGCLQREADGVVRGSLPTGLLLEHDGHCPFTGAVGDACAHWGEQVLRDIGGIDALSDPMRPRQAFAVSRLLADGTETECLVEVRRGARSPCRAFVTPVTGPPTAAATDGAPPDNTPPDNTPSDNTPSDSIPSNSALPGSA